MIINTSVTINHTKVSADLTDFPILVNLADMPLYFWSNVKEDGADIRVYKADGTTEVPFEIVWIDTILKTGNLYFKGDISSTEDTIFYINYGNPDAVAYDRDDTYGSDNVWTGAAGIYHCAVNADDSSANAATGTLKQITQETGYLDFPGEVLITDSLSGDTTIAVGTNAVVKLAQSFIITDTIDARLDTLLKRVAETGVPVGTIKIGIETDNAGSPSGVGLDSDTLTYTEWHAGTTADNIVATFGGAGSLGLEVGVTYWLVITISVADDAKYYNVKYDPAGTYGVLKSYNGAAWSVVPGSLRMRLFKSGYVQLSAASSVPYNDFTISFALKKTTSTYQQILSYGIGGSNAQVEINKFLNKLRFESRTSNVYTQNELVTNVDTADGEFHFYNIVSDDTSFRTYADGVLSDTDVVNDDPADQAYQYFGAIANRLNATYGIALEGQLKDIRFRSALSANQIATEYNNQSSPSTFYTLDNGFYSLTYSAGSNGSLVGETTQRVAEADDGSQITAVPDSGYVFDEWDDYYGDNIRTDRHVDHDIDVTASFVTDRNVVRRSSYKSSSRSGYRRNKRNGRRA